MKDIKKMDNNVAILLASGSGARFSGDKKLKQFFGIAGKTIMEYTLDTFEKHPFIDRIILVINQKYTRLCQDLIRKNNFKKVINVFFCLKLHFYNIFC